MKTRNYGLIIYLVILVMLQWSAKLFNLHNCVAFYSYAQEPFIKRVIIAFFLNCIIGCFIWSFSKIKYCKRDIDKHDYTISDIHMYPYYIMSEICIYLLLSSLFSFVSGMTCFGFEWDMTTFDD